MGRLAFLVVHMSTTPEGFPKSAPESAVSSVSESAPGSAHALTGSVSKKVSDAVPVSVAEAAKLDEDAEEGKRLLALYEALRRTGYAELSQNEYQLLLDYGCAYEQGPHLKARIAAEIDWFREKKKILDDAAGFWGFMKRMKLE